MFNRSKFMFGALTAFAVITTVDAAYAADAVADDNTTPQLTTAPQLTPSQQAFQAADTPSLPPFNKDPIVAPAPAPTPEVVNEPSHHPFRMGFGMDLGVPSGAAVGLVVNPGLDWVRAQASLTYDYLSFGGRGSLQLDPFALLPNCPIGLFADVQGGFQPEANIPGKSDLPAVGFDYVNLYGGLRLGKPNGFHWNFEAGPTYMHVSTRNFQSIVNQAGSGSGNLVLGNPQVNGWLVPTFETGFTVVWP
jgi:hypothetical protein